jgi:glycerol-3-phosphate acyltransferase PlsY
VNEVLAALLAAAIVVYRHKENIQRMRAGKEPEFRGGIG